MSERPDGFKIGSVFGRTCVVLARNLIRFSAVTGIATLSWLVIPGIPDPKVPLVDLHLPPLAQILTFVISVVLSQAIVFLGTFQDLRARPVSLSNCLWITLQRFFPLVGLVLCMGLVLIALGPLAIALLLRPSANNANSLLVFVIAGFALFLAWSVAMPVCVVEGLNPFRSLGRSRELTKRHRMKIVVLMLLAIIAGMAMALIIRTFVSTLLAFGPAIGLRPPTILVATALTFIAIWSAFLGVLLAVTYHDLRLAKEGPYFDQIAAIFD
jgi:hypothetical protein